MQKLEVIQMENTVGGWSWSGCAGYAWTGFQLAETTAVVTGGWGLVAGAVGGCIVGGLFS